MAMTRRDVAMGLGAGALMPPGCSSRAEPVRAARADLYACEGCEGAFERRPATAQATIAAPDERGERMRFAGRVLASDGITPASGVVIYAYHTDAVGLYSRGTAETEWSRRHGILRGWVRTDGDGRYAFDSIKPAPYPDRTLPAHIHLTVAEPGRRAYYIDDIVFDGEFGVTPAYRARQEFRGGGGITRLERANGLWLATRDIILEAHPA